MAGPHKKLRDGAVSASIWKNETKDGKIFYSVTYDRVYTDKDEKIGNDNSFSGSNILKQQRLAGKAYDLIKQLEAQDKADAEQAEAA